MKYYKNLSIDESDFSVQRQGCRIHLTTTEYQLFITLLDHSGCICSRNFLLASAWNITVPIQTRTVDVHIAKLRKKLDLGPDDRFLCKKAVEKNILYESRFILIAGIGDKNG